MKLRPLSASLISVAALAAALTTIPVGAASSCRPLGRAPRFAPQRYIDTERAGGEPTVETHPDGTLIYTAHAGTTHVFLPAAADEDSAAFFQHYTGQTYIWNSYDDGKTWEFVPRTVPPSGVPMSGFSDPEIAIDTAGNVYESEINLVNVAISKAADMDRPRPHNEYTLQNFFAQTMTDRQWTEADQENVVYIVGNAFAGGTFPTDPVGNIGHHLYKSKDGGRTFSPGVSDPGGLGDLQVDKRDGTLYEANLSSDPGPGDKLSMAAFRNIRNDDFTRELNTIATGVDMNDTAHWPSFDVDEKGNLYMIWSEDGGGARGGGIWYSYSTDRGRTWAAPILVDPDDDGTDIWPWLAVGSPRRVAIAWLEADRQLPDNNSEEAGDAAWRVETAVTLNGLGCRQSAEPGFRKAVATPDPVHRGTICNQGTVCQAQLIDRRMGDFFTIEIDETGMMWAGYSDTRQGGMVALPGFVQQNSGPRLIVQGRR
ncbi:MAG TPA: hypothetical protein VHL78_02970 [Actinomycetota bacterium]|nr:hypothetical protein [Actinomycetota bacterium]